MEVITQITAIDCTVAKFTPLAAQLLIKYERDKESDGGILYANEENTWWADVIRVGPDATVSAGDRVFMSLYRGENVSFLDGDFAIVEEKDALLVEEQ